jgi:two-component system, OmpR family, copper resistance phosphate regulon response regulator CusR
MPTRILLIEDDERINAHVQKSLALANYEVTSAHNGDEGFLLATTQTFDLMVLDLGLPGRSGKQILTTLRATNNHLPILILSALCDLECRMEGLMLGADDFLGKPFSMVELEVRIFALLRRGRTSQTLQLKMLDLFMDVTTRKVERGGLPIELTPLEFHLLELLMRHAHTVVAREAIASQIWRQVKRATPLDNVIDVHIGRLRKKIDCLNMPPLIHTVRGVGFLLSDKAHI